jgi:hypothetical protein
MKSKLEDSILDTSGLMKETGALLIANAGKLIALAVIMITAALTFTDVSFASFSLKDSLPSLLLLTVSSYVVYFSLEDAGERLGESTEEFIGAKQKYDALRKRVLGNEVEALRNFLDDYSERELASRRANLLMYLGLSEAELEENKNERTVRRARRRIARMKPIYLSTRALLCNERAVRRSELESPDKRKLASLLLRLIPSTLCMALTVSVILTAKDGLDSTDILNGILKLSALPIVGFKGYSQGYTFSKHKESAWMQTKAGIIESFLSLSKSEAPRLDIAGKV